MEELLHRGYDGLGTMDEIVGHKNCAPKYSTYSSNYIHIYNNFYFYIILRYYTILSF